MQQASRVADSSDHLLSPALKPLNESKLAKAQANYVTCSEASNISASNVPLHKLLSKMILEEAVATLLLQPENVQ